MYEKIVWGEFWDFISSFWVYDCYPRWMLNNVERVCASWMFLTTQSLGLKPCMWCNQDTECPTTMIIPALCGERFTDFLDNHGPDMT